MIALNIAMPKTCRECPCQDMNEEYSPFCYAALCMGKTLFVNRNGRPDGCPLIAVKDTRNNVSIKLDSGLLFQGERLIGITDEIAIKQDD